MKLMTTFLLMVLLSFALSLILPWWVMAPACFLLALLSKFKIWKSICIGFVAIFLHWMLMAWWLSENNEHILATRMSILLFKAEQPMLLIFMTGLLGGIIGAVSAGAGALLVKKENRK